MNVSSPPSVCAKQLCALAHLRCTCDQVLPNKSNFNYLQFLTLTFSLLESKDSKNLQIKFSNIRGFNQNTKLHIPILHWIFSQVHSQVT